MQTILDISTVIWLFPIARNIKGNYRWVFIFLGISDLLFLFLNQIKGINPNISVLIVDIMIINLFNRKYLNRGYFIQNIGFCLMILLTTWFFDIGAHETVLIFDIVIIGKFLKVLFDEILVERHINLFSFLLFLNFLLMTLNTTFIVINPEWGVTYFYSTLIAMMFLALFFTIFSDDSKMLIFNLKEDKKA